MTLQEKVLEWLRNEGYPLEFRTAKACRTAGFRVRQGIYARAEGQSPREIDVMTESYRDIDEDTILRVTQVIECKYSKSYPWVVLSSDHAGIGSSACVAQTLANDFGSAILWYMAGDDQVTTLDLFSAPGRPGFGGRQALANKQDVFYAAVQSVVGATRARLDCYNADYIEDSLGFAEIALPIIVIDGHLFEAYQDDDGEEMKVESRDSVRIHWRGADAWDLHASIDIVTADALPAFLEKRKADVETFLQRAVLMAMQIKACHSERSLSSLPETQVNRGFLGMPRLLEQMEKSFAVEAQSERK